MLCVTTSVIDDGAGKADDEVKYVLQYFYYGGCIYAALKNFSRALHFLEMCLSVPNQQTTSAIQVWNNPFLEILVQYPSKDNF